MFANKGSVTAGNSSQTSDGSGALLVVSEKVLKQFNLTPLARFVSFAVRGVPPEIMGIGPKEAIPAALKAAGLKQDDIDWIELNEAFAAQSLAVIRDLGLDPSKINPLGGAIALGHPLGMSGARLALTAVHGLEKRGGKLALATMCVGVGQGVAMAIEKHVGSAADYPSRTDFIGILCRCGWICSSSSRSTACISTSVSSKMAR